MNFIGISGLQKHLEASPYLSIDNLTSAKVDVFQAYLGAITIDNSIDILYNFIKLLLESESSSTFEEGPANLTADASFGDSGMSTPTYDVFVGTPLGTSSSPVVDTGFSPQEYPATPLPTTPPPAFNRPAFVPPSPSPLSSPGTSKGSYLAYFNETAAKRSQSGSWTLASEGPPHAPLWRATLSCMFRVRVLLIFSAHTAGSIVGGKEVGRGTAKGKQDAKNLAAQQALRTLRWSVRRTVYIPRNATSDVDLMTAPRVATLILTWESCLSCQPNPDRIHPSVRIGLAADVYQVCHRTSASSWLCPILVFMILTLYI